MKPTTPTPPAKNSARPFDRIAAALESVGLRLAIPNQPITDVNDLATRITVAAMNYASARREERERRSADDDF